MVKLYCLVTIPPSSVSSVELDESCTLDDLKKEIKTKNENVVKCDADKLHLYLAQRDGNWLNHWAVMNLKPCALDLECLKYPQMSLKCAGLGEDRAPLLSEEELSERNGVLHVVVVAPVQTCDIKVYVDEAVDEAIKAHDKKRDVYLFDECPSTKVDELKQSLGLSIKLFDVNETQDCSVPGFAWNGEVEPNELLSYVKTNLQDVFATPDYFLKDAASYEHLLWMNDTRLEFAVKGTTGMVIVDKAAEQFRDPRVGLCFIIKVEKDLCDDFERHETGMLLKLIAADFVSEPRRAPVALLTDLNNAWYFFWFTEEKEIAILLLESPANSFQFIKDVLSSGPGTTEDGVYLAKSSIVANDDGLKRQKLSTLEPPLADMAAWETLQRFESISDQLSPEFMRERRLEYFLRSLSQMPNHSYMTLLEEE